MSKLLAKFLNYNKAPADNSAVGANLQEFINRLCPPTAYQTTTYNPDGTVNQIIIYKNSNDILANRRVRIAFGYDANLNLITETIEQYNFNDGTVLEKTTTFTYSYNGNDEFQNVSQATT